MLTHKPTTKTVVTLLHEINTFEEGRGLSEYSAGESVSQSVAGTCGGLRRDDAAPGCQKPQETMCRASRLPGVVIAV